MVTLEVKTHILCKGRNTAKYYKELFSQKVRFRGEYVTGSLKDVPLNKVLEKTLRFTCSECKINQLQLTMLLLLFQQL